MKLRLLYFNDKYNLYFEDHSIFLKNPNTTVIEHPQGEYRLRDYGNGFYSYGFMSKIKTQRPGHGGEWSSRCSVINNVFGTSITECALNSGSCSIDINILKEMLPESLRIETVEHSHDEENEGPRYSVLPKIKTEDHKEITINVGDLTPKKDN